jgi:hypothetical protein
MSDQDIGVRSDEREVDGGCNISCISRGGEYRTGIRGDEREIKIWMGGNQPVNPPFHTDDIGFCACVWE